MFKYMYYKCESNTVTTLSASIWGRLGVIVLKNIYILFYLYAVIKAYSSNVASHMCRIQFTN
jgi:hypothetical protein